MIALDRVSSGMSTLELIIAFAIVSLSLTATVLVLFGNQSISVDAETHREALSLAQKSMAEMRVHSRDRFADLNSTATYETLSSFTYTKNLTVTDITPCKKLATTSISWELSPSRELRIELPSYFADLKEVRYRGGDCDGVSFVGDWVHPEERSFTTLGPAKGIDVFGGEAFLSLKNTLPSDADLAIVDVTSSTTPVVRASIDVKGQPGFNALDIATSTDGRSYAYIANNNPIGQLLVLDVTDPASPILVASSTLPGISTGVGRSIFYYDNKVYIGTSFFVCGGCRELHIYDVTDPTNPIWRAAIDVNRNVNAILVHDGVLYVATGPGTPPLHNPLKVYNINPAIPGYLAQIGSFTATGNEQGTSLYLLGRKLYVGLERATSGRPDLYVLDVADPAHLVVVASKNLGLHTGSAVSGIRIVGDLGFIATSDPANNLSVRDVSKLTLDAVGLFTISETVTGIDSAQNAIYLASSGAVHSLEIIGPRE